MSLMFIKNVEPSKIGYSITTTSLELNVNINNYFLGWNTPMLLWQQVSKQDGKCMYGIYMWHILGKFQNVCTYSVTHFHFQHILINIITLFDTNTICCIHITIIVVMATIIETIWRIFIIFTYHISKIYRKYKQPAIQ